MFLAPNSRAPRFTDFALCLRSLYISSAKRHCLPTFSSTMAEDKSKMPKAAYRQLGLSGLRVSNPIFGTMSLGDKRWAPWVIEEADALPLLKAAYDRGVNTWDTANVYSNGVSEEIIGKAIKKYGLERHKLVILTKCCGTVREGNDPDTLALRDIDKTVDYVNQRGLSRQGIFNAVDASLKRLGTDYIDLLQIHRYDATVPVEETMKALHDLVESGKVRYIGASSMVSDLVARSSYIVHIHIMLTIRSGQYNSPTCRELPKEMGGRNLSVCKESITCYIEKKNGESHTV